MRYFESKQIHSSTSTFSSEDWFVVREITRAEFLAHGGEKTVSRKHGFSVAYSESDRRFYGRSFSFGAKKEEIRNYAVDTYLLHGWTVDHPFLKAAKSAYWKDEEAADKARRTKQGYVIPAWSRHMLPGDYQGGFSDAVFFDPALFDYVKGGGCHGYIGHSVRKPKLDAYLEQQFLKANPDKSLLAMWLTSTGGRHFGDSLECCSFREQQAYIRKNVASLIEQAVSYRKQDAAA